MQQVLNKEQVRINCLWEFLDASSNFSAESLKLFENSNAHKKYNFK